MSSSGLQLFTLIGYYNAGALSRDIVPTGIAQDFLS